MMIRFRLEAVIYALQPKGLHAAISDSYETVLEQCRKHMRLRISTVEDASSQCKNILI